jgi:hypothetical protein
MKIETKLTGREIGAIIAEGISDNALSGRTRREKVAVADYVESLSIGEFGGIEERDLPEGAGSAAYYSGLFFAGVADGIRGDRFRYPDDRRYTPEEVANIVRFAIPSDYFRRYVLGAIAVGIGEIAYLYADDASTAGDSLDDIVDRIGDPPAGYYDVPTDRIDIFLYLVRLGYDLEAGAEGGTGKGLLATDRP